MMKTDSRIYVAGHSGLVGSAIERRLRLAGYQKLLLRSHRDLDLTDRDAVSTFFKDQRPEYVFLAAARVGGIIGNQRMGAQFIHDNLEIQTNTIHQAYLAGVTRLLFLGSSCIYPSQCPQPIKEEYLLTGPLESTNRPYAIAKIAGIEMCRAYNRQYGTKFLAAMPTNLFGPGDNYDLENSHVIPALIRKIDDARRANSDKVVLWGTGAPRREFLHSDDVADACVFLLELPDSKLDSLLQGDQPPLVNIGYSKDITIVELAHKLARVIGFKGKITFDPKMPDGTPRKLLDTKLLQSLGWRPKLEFEQALKATYENYQTSLANC
jgi:GDP-L-fucose synthase